MRPLKLSSLAAILTLALTHACAEPECPHGFYKIDSTCLRIDGGKAVTSDEAGVNAGDDGVDSGTLSGIDAGDSSPGPVSTTDAAALMDATTITPTGDAGGNPAPAPECDSTHLCGAGLVCSATKCVSACTQTQCDPNATCSLIANAPVCTCNGSFIAMTGPGGAITCLRDVACEELGCDVEAGCEVINQLRTCVCKNGYTGTGKVCTPVSCLMPTLENGTVTTSGGVTFDSTATYRCNSGYDFSSGGPMIITRKCGADRSWGAAVPSCAPKNCGSLSIDNGIADTSGGTTYGSPPVTFICRDGFSRLGPGTADCQANGTWTPAPTCWACGDGIVTMGVESCDPKAMGWSPWTCDPSTCQPDTQKMYRACAITANCGSGQVCATVCVSSTTCTQDTQCQQVPVGSGAVAKCRKGLEAGVCMATCTSASQCAPGLTCNANQICAGCSGSAPCPADNPVCELYSGASFGRCRRQPGSAVDKRVPL